MQHLTTISEGNIPKILEGFASIRRCFERIEKYACQDFRSTKSILDVLRDLDIELILSDAAKEKLSAIISDLQYVDILQQRLSHVIRINELLRTDLTVLHKNSGDSVIAYRPLVKLNLKQFQDAIDLYLHTTDAVHGALTEISKNHRMLFLHIPETKLLYKYSPEILKESTAVRYVYEYQLLKYQQVPDTVSQDNVKQVKKVANFYTMEQERLILDAFLKTEMNYEQGYDTDTDKEQISLF